MQTLKGQFDAQFTVTRMSNNSLVLRENKTGETCYIHRNAYNAILNGAAVDLRIVDGDEGMLGGFRWVEVLVWKRL